MEIHETSLPGIGVRHEFRTQSGRLVGLVSHRSGRRDVLLYDPRDPDAAGETVVLTADEAEALATLLGAARITRELTELPEQVAGLVVEWLQVPVSSPYAGRSLGDTRARTRTGASVVALVRDSRVEPSPGPEHGLLAGDTLVVVGTAQGVEALSVLLLQG